MELSGLLIFKIAAFLVAVPLVIGLFGSLPWVTKLKLTGTLLVGIVLIGLFAWPLAAPSEPLGAVYYGTTTIGEAMILVALAVLAGLIGYFVCWPHGREIGILAVPAGLAVWGLRTGSMADLLKLNPGLDQQLALLSSLRWEPLFWLGVVAAGFVGVLIGHKARGKGRAGQPEQKNDPKANTYVNAAIALVGSVLIALVCIRLFAQDFSTFDRRLGSSVVAQPAAGQIAFAVCVSFGIAAFVVKKFLDASYIWPVIAGAVLTGVAGAVYLRQDGMGYLLERWPPVFFLNATLSILPLQMVAFGTLGSVAGYWMAVHYNYWRKHG